MKIFTNLNGFRLNRQLRWIQSIAIGLLICLSPMSHGWEVGQNVTIEQLVQWEGAGNFLVILSDNKKCYAPLVDKELYSMVLALYMAN